MKKTASILLCAVIGGLTLLLTGAQLLPDTDISYSERRDLEQLKDVAASDFWHSNANPDDNFDKVLESYLADQFPLREPLRRLNTWINFNLLGRRDVGGVYIAQGQAGELDAAVNELDVQYAADRVQYVRDTYLDGMKVYAAIIPSKNYYLAGANGYPDMDYDKLTEIFFTRTPGMEVIQLWDLLEGEDYYPTDLHWKQECIFPVAQRLADAMGAELIPQNAYTPQSLSPFYGAYSAQSALPGDTLTFLNSPYTKGARVTDLTGQQFKGIRPVYMPGLINGTDGYDVFLSGPMKLISIEVPNAQTDKELIIFRDSFGSSLAPLFTGAYARITLVDLRYISPDELGKYITFDDQDVLFLYSTTILNSGRSFR